MPRLRLDTPPAKTLLHLSWRNAGQRKARPGLTAGSFGSLVEPCLAHDADAERVRAGVHGDDGADEADGHLGGEAQLVEQGADARLELGGLVVVVAVADGDFELVGGGEILAQILARYAQRLVEALAPAAADAGGEDLALLERDDGPDAEHGADLAGQLAYAAAYAQVGEAADGEEDASGRPYLVHAGHGLVQGKARVAQVAGLEHVEPLEHGVHHGVVHRDLDVGIVLAQQLQRYARGLVGVRELFGYADADGLLARLGHLAEDLEEVLGRGRGALRVHAGMRHHPLVKLLRADILVLLEVLSAAEHDVERHHGDIALLVELGREVARTVGYDPEFRHSHPSFISRCSRAAAHTPAAPGFC